MFLTGGGLVAMMCVLAAALVVVAMEAIVRSPNEPRWRVPAGKGCRVVRAFPDEPGWAASRETPAGRSRGRRTWSNRFDRCRDPGMMNGRSRSLPDFRYTS
jgi:hypothetical protein